MTARNRSSRLSPWSSQPDVHDMRRRTTADAQDANGRPMHRPPIGCIDYAMLELEALEWVNDPGEGADRRRLLDLPAQDTAEGRE